MISRLKSFFAPTRLAPLGWLLLGALLLFHVWLLARRVAEGELLEAGVLWRWLGAFALLLFWGLQRRLAHRLSPRARRSSGLAFWTLVLLLHGGGLPMAPVPGMAALPLAEVGTLALPLLAVFLLLERAGAAAADPLPAWRGARVRRERGRLALAAGFLPQLSCRPPPALR